jgi:hypothetical protein
MEIEVFVEGEGLTEVEAIRIPQGGLGREIVAAVAAKGGFPAEDGILFIEDVEEPVDLAVVVIEENCRGKVHHVHRARQVEVAVYYQSHDKDKRFSPSARVQRVLDWAVGPLGFNIDRAIAPEMELALHGSTTALPRDAHIGRFIRHPHHKVAFDLIRGTVPNGGLS